MTIKDIAAKCGVSVSTVSRVLNNHPYVKEDVRERVLKVIEEEHFVPHDSAVDLVRSNEESVGLVVRGIGNTFYSDMIPVIERAVTEAGYTFIMKEIKSDENEIHAAAALSKAKRLKGVILLGGRYDVEEEEMQNLNIPFVCCTFTNTFGVVNKKHFSSVTIADGEEAYKATEYLIKNGHKKIAILLPATKDHAVSEARFLGYKKALKDNGLSFDEGLVAESGSFGMKDAYDAMLSLANKRKDFTAVFAISDLIGIAGIKALNEAGRKVPEDCSIIGIDGIILSEFTIPTLTTLVQPREELAVCAVNNLVEMIKGEKEFAHTILRTTLRTGGSVAVIA
ncbi:MAG: LacI family transcriptional regulator [Lachnospiraceae bacterium]|nr:LacI family transcriptional regulator [Lachnospiraceae bacterium]